MDKTELKQWRTSRHLTQSKAAALVGAGSYRTWQNWELGERPVPVWMPKMLKLLDKDKRNEN